MTSGYQEETLQGQRLGVKVHVGVASGVKSRTIIQSRSRFWVPRKVSQEIVRQVEIRDSGEAEHATWNIGQLVVGGIQICKATRQK